MAIFLQRFYIYGPTYLIHFSNHFSGPRRAVDPMYVPVLIRDALIV